MNDRDIPVYLSVEEISVLRAAVEQYARGLRDYGLERSAYSLSERLRVSLDEYREEIRQAKGRGRRGRHG